MQLYNTLSHKKEEFVPNVAGRVAMYTCGPTVYHYAHIGNLRSYIMEDVHIPQTVQGKSRCPGPLKIFPGRPNRIRQERQKQDGEENQSSLRGENTEMKSHVQTILFLPSVLYSGFIVFQHRPDGNLQACFQERRTGLQDHPASLSRMLFSHWLCSLHG